jgi:hypothetical protein
MRKLAEQPTNQLTTLMFSISLAPLGFAAAVERDRFSLSVPMTAAHVCPRSSVDESKCGTA